MPTDPSSHQLPPEMVEAIYGVAREAFGVAWTNARVDAICAALAPLLAERDAEKDAAIGRLQAAYRSLDADWGRSQAEARRLREALEWYGDVSNYGPDGDPGEAIGGGTDPETGCFEIDEWEVDLGRRARAALSASPDPEGSDSAIDRPQQPDPCSDCDGTGIGGHGGTCPTCGGSRVAPVSVPEQEEGQCESCRGDRHARFEGGGIDHTRPCPLCAAASSSSSEERERAARAWTLSFDPEAGDVSAERGPILEPGEHVIAVDGADVLLWLRERLTSDEAVEAWERAVIEIVPVKPGDRRHEIVRDRLAAVAAVLLNDTSKEAGA